MVCILEKIVDAIFLLTLKITTDSDKSAKSVAGEKMSAAGLCVGIGSYSDPEELQGLAHFLEHMVSTSRFEPRESHFL